MTIHNKTVCVECGTPYYHQTSGNDAPEYNTIIHLVDYAHTAEIKRGQ